MQILPTFQPRAPKTTFGHWLGIIILIGVILLAPFLWWRNKQQEKNKTENITTEQRVLQHVSRSVDLSNEQPRLQYIENPEIDRAINPTVYSQAEAGDWMIFTSKHIYIYRESQNKILLISAQ